MGARLEGKVALVTGAGRRIGQAIALALAEAGAGVVIHYRDSIAGANATASQIQDRGSKAWLLRADLTSARELSNLIPAAVRQAGRLDILVNNASIFHTSVLESVTAGDLHRDMDINAWAPLVLSRDFAALGVEGHIVNILDARIGGYDWGHVSYHASKTLLLLFTRMMAVRFAPKVAVNAVAPGLILPPEGEDYSYLESLKDTNLLKKIGDPRQVAEAVVFLVGSEFITGQVIFVDGGRHLRNSGR